MAQAFRLQQTPVDGGVRLHFDIAPGYYLYHDRFRFTGARPQFRQTGHRKQDPNFGWVTVHETALDIDLVALPAAGCVAQLPVEGLADRNTSPEGSVSETVTFSAWLRPFATFFAVST